MAEQHGEEGRAVLLRVAAPGVALLALLVVLGLLLTPPGITWDTTEESISTGLEASRTATWNTVTLAWSLLGSHGGIIGIGLFVSALLLARTQDRRLAAVPVVASLLHETIFLIAANIVDRPRPEVVHLDEAPPTASYPSGHVGAATTLYLTFALLALQLGTAWVRRLTVVVCVAVPLLVAYGRLYRGMHHLTDVGAALLNGVVCALLAYWWYRASTRDRASPPAEPVRTGDGRPG